MFSCLAFSLFADFLGLSFFSEYKRGTVRLKGIIVYSLNVVLQRWHKHCNLLKRYYCLKGSLVISLYHVVIIIHAQKKMK